MKKTDYINALDNIKMSDEEKLEIRSNIIDKATDTSPRKAKYPIKRIGVVATAVACIAIIATPVISSGVDTMLTRLYPMSESVAEKVETDIFEDSDGHIRLSVKEMLSDNQVITMTVCYEALDDEGKQWLSTFDFEANHSLYIEPDSPKVSCSYGSREIKEQRTETQRWFYVIYQGSQKNTEDSSTFYYIMPSGAESAALDTSGIVETHTYTINSSHSTNEDFRLKQLNISDISFTIFVENIGVYHKYEENGVYVTEMIISEEDMEAIISSSYFIMENGEKIQILRNGGFGSGVIPSENNNYSDLVLLEGTYEFFDDQTQSYGRYHMESEKVVGLEIMGEYYELK